MMPDHATALLAAIGSVTVIVLTAAAAVAAMLLLECLLDRPRRGEE